MSRREPLFNSPWDNATYVVKKSLRRDDAPKAQIALSAVDRGIMFSEYTLWYLLKNHWQELYTRLYKGQYSSAGMKLFILDLELDQQLESWLNVSPQHSLILEELITTINEELKRNQNK